MYLVVSVCMSICLFVRDLPAEQQRAILIKWLRKSLWVGVHSGWCTEKEETKKQIQWNLKGCAFHWLDLLEQLPASLGSGNDSSYAATMYFFLYHSGQFWSGTTCTEYMLWHYILIKIIFTVFQLILAFYNAITYQNL